MIKIELLIIVNFLTITHFFYKKNRNRITWKVNKYKYVNELKKIKKRI